MERVPEPALMEEAEACEAYARADFAAAHDGFVALLRARLAGLPEEGLALDLGCGPGDVTRRFARALPGWRVVGVDGSAEMLRWAERLTRDAGLDGRIHYREALVGTLDVAALAPDLVLSNSLLHHLVRPAALWDGLASLAPGTPAFVMDLLRPSDEAGARALVERWAAGEPPVLRRDFERSLRAAYTPDEVRAQLRAAPLPGLEVETVTDRHWIAFGATGART